MNSLKKNQRGNILMITLLVLTTTLTISLGAAILVTQGILMHRSVKWSTTAYYAAEAGAEEVLYRDRKEEDPENNFKEERLDGSACQDGDYIQFDPTGCTSEVTAYSLANGAEYFITYIADLNYIKFRITGSYEDARRSVRISYLRE